MQDRFQQLLNILSKHLQVLLHPDKNLSCLLTINNKISVQMELDKEQESLLIGCFIAEITAGSFRENLFKHALITNNSADRLGILAYNEKDSSFTFFDYLPIDNITDEFFIEYFKCFVDCCFMWKEAIEIGKPGIYQSKILTPSPFDVKSKL